MLNWLVPALVGLLAAGLPLVLTLTSRRRAELLSRLDKLEGSMRTLETASAVAAAVATAVAIAKTVADNLAADTKSRGSV